MLHQVASVVLIFLRVKKKKNLRYYWLTRLDAVRMPPHHLQSPRNREHVPDRQNPEGVRAYESKVPKTAVDHFETGRGRKEGGEVYRSTTESAPRGLAFQQQQFF